MGEQVGKDQLAKVKKPSTHGGKSGEEGGGVKAAKLKAEGLRVSDASARTKPHAAFGKDMTQETYGRTELPYSCPLFLILVGQKGSAKSTACTTIPRPNNGVTFFLSFDRQTWPGMKRFYSQEVLQNVVVHDLTEPQPERDYPGFDPNKPETAVRAIDEGASILDMLQDGRYWTKILEMSAEDIPSTIDADEPEDIRVDNLMMDHAQYYHKNVAPSRVTHDNFNSDVLANFGMSDWGDRTKLSKLFIAKAYRVPAHAFVLSGYSKKDSWRKSGSQFVKEIIDTNWYEKWKKPAHAILEHVFNAHQITDSSQGFRPEFKVVVQSTKSDIDDLFPLGHEFDITSPIPDGEVRPQKHGNDGSVGYAQFWLESGDEELAKLVEV